MQVRAFERYIPLMSNLKDIRRTSLISLIHTNNKVYEARKQERLTTCADAYVICIFVLRIYTRQETMLEINTGL